MSQNYWIKKGTQKKLHLEIDRKAMDCWSTDDNFGSFLKSLTKEEMDYLQEFKIKDFLGDPNEPSFGFELYCD